MKTQKFCNNLQQFATSEQWRCIAAVKKFEVVFDNTRFSYVNFFLLFLFSFQSINLFCCFRNSAAENVVVLFLFKQRVVLLFPHHSKTGNVLCLWLVLRMTMRHGVVKKKQLVSFGRGKCTSTPYGTTHIFQKKKKKKKKRSGKLNSSFDSTQL